MLDVNVLVASYAYPPLRYPRAIQVARLVSRLPPESVTVVCASEPGEGDLSLLAAYPDSGRRVVRVPWSRSSRAARVLRNRTLEDRLLVPDRYRPWQRDAARAVRRLQLSGNSDVLVTFGQPMSDHLLGLRFGGRHGLPWIAHFSDPWVDSPFRAGGRVTRRLNERLEARVIRRADAVLFTSQESRELVMSKYPRSLEAKSFVLPHAHDAALYPAHGGGHEGLLLRYIGNFYGHRGPEPLFKALRVLARTQPEILTDVRVELIGRREHPLPQDALAGFPRGLVSVRDAVGYTESLALMRGSDVLLVVDAPADRGVFLPSKLIDYLGARRPIVALTPEGAASTVVRKAGGWHADPADPEAAAGVLAAAISAARQSQRDEWGRADVVEAFAASTVADEFGRLLASVRSSRAVPAT